jgi:hypothetical protein
MRHVSIHYYWYLRNQTDKFSVPELLIFLCNLPNEERKLFLSLSSPKKLGPCPQLPPHGRRTISGVGVCRQPPSSEARDSRSAGQKFMKII